VFARRAKTVLRLRSDSAVHATGVAITLEFFSSRTNDVRLLTSEYVKLAALVSSEISL
jgi:hypothetical protein